jgi:hypothetical protein
MRLIYDLDHTLVDSSHRQATLPNGNLNLAHWIENSTPEKVAQDTLLPLADVAKRNMGRCEVIACTARVMGDADYDFLLGHGLLFDRILSRPEGVQTPDAQLKVSLLWADAMEQGKNFYRYARESLVFDDNENVNITLASFGFRCYNAISINKELSA